MLTEDTTPKGFEGQYSKQVCDQCHHRRERCDREIPRCRQCEVRQTECTYSRKLKVKPNSDQGCTSVMTIGRIPDKPSRKRRTRKQIAIDTQSTTEITKPSEKFILSTELSQIGLQTYLNQLNPFAPLFLSDRFDQNTYSEMLLISIYISGLTLLDPTPEISLALPILYKQLIQQIEQADHSLEFLQTILVNYLGLSHHLPDKYITSTLGFHLNPRLPFSSHEAYLACSLAQYLLGYTNYSDDLIREKPNLFESAPMDKSVLIISNSLLNLSIIHSSILKTINHNNNPIVITTELYNSIMNVLGYATEGLRCSSYHPHQLQVIEDHKFIVGIHIQRVVIQLLQSYVSVIMNTIPEVNYLDPGPIPIASLAVSYASMASQSYIHLYSSFTSQVHANLSQTLYNLIQEVSFQNSEVITWQISYLSGILTFLQNFQLFPTIHQ